MPKLQFSHVCFAAAVFIGSLSVLGCPSTPAPNSQVSVPNLVGMTRSAAGAAITGAGLLVGTVTEQYHAVVAAGTVISQNPTAGARVNSGTSVRLFVSAGPEPAHDVAVPNVVGTTRSAAVAAITGAGLLVGTVTEQYHAVVAAGNVISQTPAAGTLVPAGNPVNLVVSKGPAPVTVPNVVGMDLSATAAALTHAGLAVGTVTEQYSATLSVGRVISQSLAPGTSVSPGTAVNLVVSKGTPPDDYVTVPDVVGMSQSDAENRLIVAGLTAGIITEEYSDSIGDGCIIRQNPPAGASVRPGGAVDLVVSRGTAAVTEVPNVVGMPISDAEVVLNAAGLIVGTVTEAYSDTVAAGHIISQDPLPGENVAEGAAVQFVVSQGITPDSALDSVGAIILGYNPPATGYPGYTGVSSNARFGLLYMDSWDFVLDLEPDTCLVSDDIVEFPELTYTPLDPGDPGEITIGANHAYLWKQVYAAPDGSYTQTSYLQEPVYMMGSPGDLVSIFWPGGIDIKTFSLSTRVIHSPVFLQPQLPSATAPSINFDQDLPLTWETRDDGAYVVFSIVTLVGSDSAMCACLLRDDGSFTVPRQYLQAIKPEGEFLYLITGDRQRIEHSTVELVDGTSRRLDIVWNSSVTETGYHEE